MKLLTSVTVLIAGLATCFSSTGPAIAQANGGWVFHGTLRIDGADRSLSFDKETTTKAECVAFATESHDQTRSMLAGSTYRSEWVCENNTGSNEVNVSGVFASPVGAIRADAAPSRVAESRNSGASGNIIRIQCDGRDGLSRSNTSFVFNIDLEQSRFDGQERSMIERSGSASAQAGLILMSYSDATGRVVMYVDRNAGTFKADRSTTSGLYLMNNITGSCRPFSGPRF